MTRPLPHPGEIWRPRRHQQRQRTLKITAVDDYDGGFIYTETLTNHRGVPPLRRTTSRIRRWLFLSDFEPAGD